MRLKPPAAQQDGATPTPSGGKPTVYRALGSLVSGALMMLFGLVLAAALAFGDDKHPVGVGIGLLLVAAGVVGGLYPTAKSYEDRLEINNPFRRIVVAWPRLDEVSARLSLVVETKPEAGAEKGRKFTVWAVPVSMHERRKADRALAKQTRDARQDAMITAKRMGNTESLLHGGRGSGSMRGRQGVGPALEVMAFADQAVVEMKDRRRICDTPEAEAAATRVTWTWWTLALSGAAVLVLLLAIAGAL